MPSQEPWPELLRLSDKHRVLPEQYADLQDYELIDSFDREMGRNPYILHPTPETYKPWDSYSVTVPYQGEQQVSGSTADHYYSYWQAYQLFEIQQYPDLYKNKFLLDQIPDEIKERCLRPRAPNQETLRKFNGLAHGFDALSFWITVHTRERNRTFALIPEKHRVRRLDAPKLEIYRDRLKDDATLVSEWYGITEDDIYGFMHQLIELYNDYLKKERYKLSDDLRNDIIYQAQLIGALSGKEWEAIAEELGKRYTFWTKQTFRHLDVLIKERDEARGLITHFAEKYCEVLAELKISGSTRTFPTTEIDELLDYCQREGFSVLLTALSGMIATQEESAKKFRRVSLYTNLKNALTTLEFLLKDFAQKGSITIDRLTLNPTIRNVMKNETWSSLFVAKTNSGLTNAKDSVDFFANLTKLLSDADLVQSEDAYWARVFLIASLARNLTVHTFPSDDWFYGELFDETLRATIYAILYSWQLAKREGWT